MAERHPSPQYHDDDVIAFGDSTFKVGKFRKAIQQCFGHDVGYGLMTLLANQGVKIDKSTISPDGDKSTFGDWFDEGVDCEVLTTNGMGWRNAKISISIDINIEVELPDAQDSPGVKASPASKPLPPVPPPSKPRLQPPFPPHLMDMELDDQDATLHSDMWTESPTIVEPNGSLPLSGG